MTWLINDRCCGNATHIPTNTHTHTHTSPNKYYAETKSKNEHRIMFCLESITLHTYGLDVKSMLLSSQHKWMNGNQKVNFEQIPCGIFPPFANNTEHYYDSMIQYRFNRQCAHFNAFAIDCNCSADTNDSIDRRRMCLNNCTYEINPAADSDIPHNSEMQWMRYEFIGVGPIDHEMTLMSGDENNNCRNVICSRLPLVYVPTNRLGGVGVCVCWRHVPNYVLSRHCQFSFREFYLPDFAQSKFDEHVRNDISIANFVNLL